jgi:hypothetical protein
LIQTCRVELSCVVAGDSSRRSGAFVVRHPDHFLELSREPGKRLLLELANSLSGDSDLASDRVERLLLSGEAEAKLEDASLPLGKGLESGPHCILSHRVARHFGGIDGVRVGEEISELTSEIAQKGIVARRRRSGLGRDRASR